MTKPWDLHEDTIKKLYAENTLAVVRKTMMERYNFKASVRAYRGRLIKWGVRKYNCRRRDDCGSISTGSQDGSSSSGSDTASPTLSQTSVDTSSEFSGYSTSGHIRDNPPSMSNRLRQSYDTTNMETPGAYPESYGTNRVIMSPPQEVHGWQSSPTQSASPPANYGHGNATAGSAPVYYQPLSPAPSTYSSLAYESDQVNCDRRQSYPLTHARQYSASHGDSAYFPIRGDYGHEHRSAGIGSFNSRCDQVARHNSTG
ncbi:hypothetical protein F5Y09DRAFT_320541 [Xylaria sp. FL1042]|nr:hypothetical protein F5Y09DRAFT_320541 [Xylaria sp. FL1042]